MSKTIIFNHMAKTGGTSVFNHVRDNIAPERFFSAGHHANMHRFFKGLPLLSEHILHAQTKPPEFIIGHNVGAGEVRSVCAPEPCASMADFALCLRDPIKHAISQVHHQRLSRARQGRSQDDSAYLRSLTADRASAGMLKSLGFLSDNSESLRDRAFSALRCVRYLMTTEKLGEQSQPLMDHLGIPPLDRHSRKTRQHPLELDHNALSEKFALDREIHHIVLSGQRDAYFPYDPDYHDHRIRSLLTAEGPAEPEADYRELAKYLCSSGKLPAARLYLDLANRRGPLTDIIYHFDPDRSRMPPETLAIEAAEQGQVYLQFKRNREAESCFRKALELNKNLPVAMRQLALVLKRSGRRAEATPLVEQYLRYRPDDPAFNKEIGLS